jgi:hypothetical protein
MISDLQAQTVERFIRELCDRVSMPEIDPAFFVEATRMMEEGWKIASPGEPPGTTDVRKLLQTLEDSELVHLPEVGAVLSWLAGLEKLVADGWQFIPPVANQL